MHADHAFNRPSRPRSGDGEREVLVARMASHRPDDAVQRAEDPLLLRRDARHASRRAWQSAQSARSVVTSHAPGVLRHLLPRLTARPRLAVEMPRLLQCPLVDLEGPPGTSTSALRGQNISTTPHPWFRDRPRRLCVIHADLSGLSIARMPASALRRCSTHRRVARLMPARQAPRPHLPHASRRWATWTALRSPAVSGVREVNGFVGLLSLAPAFDCWAGVDATRPRRR